MSETLVMLGYRRLPQAIARLSSMKDSPQRSRPPDSRTSYAEPKIDTMSAHCPLREEDDPGSGLKASRLDEDFPLLDDDFVLLDDEAAFPNEEVPDFDEGAPLIDWNPAFLVGDTSAPGEGGLLPEDGPPLVGYEASSFDDKATGRLGYRYFTLSISPAEGPA